MLTDTLIGCVERGLIPDLLVRLGIRQLLKQRLQELEPAGSAGAERYKTAFIEYMQSAPVAPVPQKANEQHYEVPTEFFREILGPHMKYSACYWPKGVDDLATAEQAALDLTFRRAGLRDGMAILELGCGWGSLTLWMAEHLPNSRVIAVSNSASQRRHIMLQAAHRGLDNVDVVTADMNDFDTEERFDRVLSVEMFEHMRNYRILMQRIYRWLKPDGCFFMHIFCHRVTPYEFIDKDAGDWMSRYFFSGGIMPSDDLPAHFQQDLKLARQWRWSGRHYQKTANAWLARMDARKDRLLPLLDTTYGAGQGRLWWMRWRVFFMACAELFGYADGKEWLVGHYLFERRAARAPL